MAVDKTAKFIVQLLSLGLTFSISGHILQILETIPVTLKFPSVQTTKLTLSHILFNISTGAYINVDYHISFKTVHNGLSRKKKHISS